MDAIAFLVKEHNKIRRSLTAIKKKKQYATQKLMFDGLCRYLVRHETLEHKVWYPHFRNGKGLKTEVKHLLSEEKHAAKAIKQFKKLKTQAQWKAKFAKFKKAVEHHAREEERDLFPNVREIMEKAKLVQIGKKMRQFERRYKKKK